MNKVLDYWLGIHPSTEKFYEMTLLQDSDSRFVTLKRYGKKEVLLYGGAIIVEADSYRHAHMVFKYGKEKKGYIDQSMHRILSNEKYPFERHSSYSNDYIHKHFAICNGATKHLLNELFPLPEEAPIPSVPAPATKVHTPNIEGWGDW